MGLPGESEAFLEELLETASPSGYEAPGQRVWVEYVDTFADEVTVDAYGNAVAVVDGGGPKVAVTGHADEIGYIVRQIDDDGYIHLSRIGGSDKTVSRGQHVVVHGNNGPVQGVIGQTALHLRDSNDVVDILNQVVDIGATDGENAREQVEVGDPITIATTVEELQNDVIAGRGLDNRVGTWAAAEALRRVSEAGTDATAYAVSTVQEEVGLKGAQMVGDELAPDAAIAVDVTHATDYPDAPGDKASDVTLGAGPVITRGSTNHPAVVDTVRAAAEAADIEYQLAAAGGRTGTDADAFYTQAGGIPSLNVGVPNRYMHTPVEVIDLADLDATAAVLAATIDRAAAAAPFTSRV